MPEIEENETERIGFSITPTLKKLVEKYVKDANISISSYIKQLIFLDLKEKGYFVLRKS